MAEACRRQPAPEKPAQLTDDLAERELLEEAITEEMEEKSATEAPEEKTRTKRTRLPKKREKTSTFTVPFQPRQRTNGTKRRGFRHVG